MASRREFAGGEESNDRLATPLDLVEIASHLAARGDIDGARLYFGNALREVCGEDKVMEAYILVRRADAWNGLSHIHPHLRIEAAGDAGTARGILDALPDSDEVIEARLVINAAYERIVRPVPDSAPAPTIPEADFGIEDTAVRPKVRLLKDEVAGYTAEYPPVGHPRPEQLRFPEDGWPMRYDGGETVIVTHNSPFEIELILANKFHQDARGKNGRVSPARGVGRVIRALRISGAEARA